MKESSAEKEKLIRGRYLASQEHANAIPANPTPPTNLFKGNHQNVDHLKLDYLDN